MNFYIQASNPKGTMKNYDENNTCLSEAIEDVFGLNTESAFICWNHIYVPVSYKYDISYMMDDIIRIITNIQEKEQGKLTICWLPDTFRSDWTIEWQGDEMTIVSQWGSTVGNLEGLLNNNNCIKLPTTQFLSEWKKVFEIIIDVLHQNGYSEKKLADMKDLIDVYKKIDDVGLLYK